MAKDMKQTPLQRFFQRHPELVQATLAAEVGISQSHLSLLVSGDREPSVDVVRRLLSVLQKYEPTLTFEHLFTSAVA
jgi:predicted transcriptional regulator